MLSTDTNLKPEVIEYRTMRYFEQAECALTTLRQLFEEMKFNSIFERSYIVLHGDHGSQISKNLPTVRNLEVMTGEDYRAHYSTLFAIKVPFGEFSLDPRSLPISTLLEEFSITLTDIEKNKHIEAGQWKYLPENETKTGAYVYLTEANRQTRIEVDIFE